MSNSKIGTTEAILIILTVIFAHSILSLPRNIITTTSSATLLNIIFITIITITLVLVINCLLKKFGTFDIIDISEYLGGKTLKNIIGFIFIAHFIICSSILLRNFCENLGFVYFQMTDVIFIILLFIIGICICNNLGFNVTIKSNLIVFPFAIISVLIIFIANLKNFDTQKIFPILGEGVSTTFGLGLKNIVAFGGIAFLYFLPPYLKKREEFKKIALISVAITGIYLILCVTTILLMFPAFYSTNEIMPLYSAARYISFGTFLQRLESIFMLIWIISFTSYLSITCKFSVNIFQKLTKTKNSTIITILFSLLILGISLLPKNLAISTFLENNIYTYLTLGIVFFLGITTLIIANIKKRIESR